MDRDAFYDMVERRADRSDRADARDAAQAVLSTLGERLSENQSHALAAELPRELGDHLTDGASGRRFPYEEFFARVEQRAERVDTGDAEFVSQVVTEATLESVDEDERAAVADSLERFDYDALLANVDVDADLG